MEQNQTQTQHRHYHLSRRHDCLVHPVGTAATWAQDRLYVCRLKKGHEEQHAYVPIELVINEP